MEQPRRRARSYTVMVDDNAHYMDTSERRQFAEFPTCAAAIAACERLVDDYLRSAYRPGMTAEVRIKVEQLPEAMQVPVQAIIEHGAEHYCMLPTATGIEARKIEIGSTNEKFVVIKDGLVFKLP